MSERQINLDDFTSVTAYGGAGDILAGWGGNRYILVSFFESTERAIKHMSSAAVAEHLSSLTGSLCCAII